MHVICQWAIILKSSKEGGIGTCFLPASLAGRENLLMLPIQTQQLVDNTPGPSDLIEGKSRLANLDHEKSQIKMVTTK